MSKLNGTGNTIDATHYLTTYTAGETIAANDAVALDLSDGKVYKASASAWSYRLNFIGFAQEARTINQSILVDTSSLPIGLTVTQGNTYYLSNTNGAIATAAGTIERKIGVAVTSQSIYRPKNRVPVSGFIARTLSTTKAYAHLDAIMVSQGGTGRVAQVNSDVLLATSTSAHMYISVPVTPSDDLTFVPVTLGGGIGVVVRIMDI
jgi:hypothetical protein